MLLYLYRRCTLFYTQIRITNMTVEKNIYIAINITTLDKIQI